MGGVDSKTTMKKVSEEYKVQSSIKKNPTAVGGVIGMQYLHSDVNLSQNLLAGMLQLNKDSHYLDLVSEMRGMWDFILTFNINI